jgi:hypothetical protein
MGADQLAKNELFRPRGAGELRLLNESGGRRSRGKRLFQSVPARDAQCPPLPAEGLSQLRKRAGQSGEQKRRPSRPINYAHDPIVNEMAILTTTMCSVQNRGSPSEPFTRAKRQVRVVVSRLRGRAVQLASHDSEEFGAFCFGPVVGVIGRGC